MRPDPRDAALLLDIVGAGEKVGRYVNRKEFGDYLADEQLRDAVERNVEIIGEAARRISEGFREEHPEIPWRKIIAQRNVLVHEYGDVHPEEMWEVATVHVPHLCQALRPLIPPIPDDPGF